MELLAVSFFILAISFILAFGTVTLCYRVEADNGQIKSTAPGSVEWVLTLTPNLVP